MVGERTLYSVLGVAPDAPIELVRAAYRALAKQYHPDGEGAGSDKAKEKFFELQAAYEIISNPETRAEYDRKTFGKDKEYLEEEISSAIIGLDEAWHKKASEYPEIKDILETLKSYSSALANRFFIAVVNDECNKDYAHYAADLDKRYFEKYFGSNIELQLLARQLLLSGNKKAAKTLNRLVKRGKCKDPQSIKRAQTFFEKFVKSATNLNTKPEEFEERSPVKEHVDAKPIYRESKLLIALAGFVATTMITFLIFPVALNWGHSIDLYPSISSKPDLYEAANLPNFESQVCGVNCITTVEGSSFDEAGESETTNPTVSNTLPIGDDVAQLPSEELCTGALNSSKEGWNSESLLSVEAENRGLSVDDCRVILGLSSSKANADGQQHATSKTRFDDQISLDSESSSYAEPVSPIPQIAKKQIYDRIVGQQEVAGDAQQLPAVPDYKTSKDVLNSSTEVQNIDHIPMIKPSNNGGYLANDPTVRPSILQSLSSRLLCASALASSYESATLVFSDYPANQQRVNEARRRGLTVEDCVAITRSSGPEIAAQELPITTSIDQPIETATAKRRVALVIGNSKYRVLPWLDNSSRDAKAMADSLAKVGFEVSLVLDATQTDLRLALAEFSQTLGDNTDVALLYYSGHAVQLQENNLLLPVNFDQEDRDEIGLWSLSLSEVIQVMNSQRVSNKILILDACRDNPLNDTTTHGLATVKAGLGTFIAYSTQPGNVAEDGPMGGNSPYTSALLSALESPNGSIEETFKIVRAAVAEGTDGRQVPWESSSLVEQFTFSVESHSTQGSVKDFQKSLERQPESNEATMNLKGKKKVPLEAAYSEAVVDAESINQAYPTPKPRPKPINQGYPTPKPRPKPIEVLMRAAVNMKTESASAPQTFDDSALSDLLPGVSVVVAEPPSDANAHQSESPLDSNSIGAVIAAETMIEADEAGSTASGKGDLHVVNREGKGSLLISPDKIGQGSMGE